ncbi:hypothetical protein PMAYCL1PPCAC_15143, partial [Pristionchus mayeri]
QTGCDKSPTRPSPPRTLPARVRCRSVHRGQGDPISEPSGHLSGPTDHPRTPRHDQDFRVCTLNGRTIASEASIATLEQSFEGIRYDVDLKEHRKRVLLKAAEEKRSLKKAKQSLHQGRTPMDAVLGRDGEPITNRSAMEHRIQEFYSDLFRSDTQVPRRKKTQLMKNEWCPGPAISLHGDPLEETDSYVYLGRELRCDGSLRTELLRRKRAAWAAFGSIREVTSQLQDAKLRASLFDSHVLPALCYAAETWPLTTTVLSFVQTTHRALERSLVGTSLHTMREANRSSEDIRRLSLLTDPVDYIRRAKHRWAGHVLRRDDDRWSTRVTQWFPPPDLTRPQGRPPARWRDSIEEYAKMPYSTGRSTRSSATRAPYRHWTTRARDREDWRTCDPRGTGR